MPVYLKDIKEFPELANFKSVLIVPCRFCPAASMAVSTDEPYFEFGQRLLATRSYEQLIGDMKSKFELMGIQTDIFRSHFLHQFVVCMWTSRRRKKLLKRARNYEALVVLGCEAAVETVYEAVKSTSCQVFQGMRTEGIMSILPRFHLPWNLSLELKHVTPLIHQAENPVPWTSL